jgi:hypothetical protein
MRRFALACATLAILVVGCAPRSANPDSSPMRGGRATIAADEIATAGAGNALEIVRRFRPSWLRPTAPQDLIAVFVDESQFGWVESLPQVSSSIIVSIEYMDRGAIQARFTSERARAISHGIRVRTPRSRTRLP